jgi:hypothetical protein
MKLILFAFLLVSNALALSSRMPPNGCDSEKVLLHRVH